MLPLHLSLNHDLNFTMSFFSVARYIYIHIINTVWDSQNTAAQAVMMQCMCNIQVFVDYCFLRHLLFSGCEQKNQMELMVTFSSFSSCFLLVPLEHSTSIRIASTTCASPVYLARWITGQFENCPIISTDSRWSVSSQHKEIFEVLRHVLKCTTTMVLMWVHGRVPLSEILRESHPAAA